MMDIKGVGGWIVSVLLFAALSIDLAELVGSGIEAAYAPGILLFFSLAAGSALHAAAGKILHHWRERSAVCGASAGNRHLNRGAASV